MAENECTHNCDTCSANCSSREAESMLAKANPHSRVKKVIGVVSGKGGVGKSMVTSLLAVTMNRRGLKTAVLDADITGPSIPRAFGVKDMLTGTDEGIVPAQSKTGVKLVSLNLLLENDTDPVIWRGPVIAGTVKQFWTDVMWGDVDFMFVDMPPGTGDVPLTVFQSLPVDGIVIVTSPQELVGMIVDQGREDGGNDEHSGVGHCGKHVLLRVSRLRQASRHFRRKPCGRRSPRNSAFPPWPGCPSIPSWPAHATRA